MIKDKKDYKNLLVDVVNQDWFDDVKKHRKDELKIGWRSDLYLYFYFRGLKLLNTDWVFTFITSNSWLDVDFGSVLQEFLIKYCPSIKIFDNQVQRSFSSASINTIMCFFDKPVIDSKDIMSGNAQFVNFNKPYEESVWTETMAELDHQAINKKFDSKEIKTGEVFFTKRLTDELRVIDINTKNLWIDWSELVSKDWLEIRKYEGNKWWGIFLRANNIYFKLLEKWSQKWLLTKIENLVENVITWVKDWWYNKYIKRIEQNFDKNMWLSILKNVKSHFFIKISNFDSYIPYEFSETISKNKHKIANILWTSMKWERYLTFECNQKTLFTWNFIWINAFESNKTEIVILLNSTLSHLFGEIFGRQMFWEWSICLWKSDLLKMNLFFNKKIELKINEIKSDLFNREIKSIFEEIWIDKTKCIRSQTPNPLTDRKKLDDIIFDELGLTQEERNEVYRSLAELVKARLDKAKSV